jgi:hypothetical protein
MGFKLWIIGFFCFMKNYFLKTTYLTLSCLFTIKKLKLINKKYFIIKVKFNLIFIIFFYFGRNTLSRSCKKFKNIMLFVDYIKFNPQYFDWCIFCFESFDLILFLILSFRILFDFIFILNLIFILLTAICLSLIFFLIEFFLSIIFGSYSFYCYLFYLE